jgi:5-methylcytosine-specific restriction protein A
VVSPPLLFSTGRVPVFFWQRTMTRLVKDGPPKDRIRRLRGSALQRRRVRLLSRAPLCEHCRLAGRVRLADELDHIIPLFMGGTDTEDNLQPLCTDCHARKTADECGTKTITGLDGWSESEPSRRWDRDWGQGRGQGGEGMS